MLEFKNSIRMGKKEKRCEMRIAALARKTQDKNTRKNPQKRQAIAIKSIYKTRV